jgi:DNA-binding transcriptional regulator YhcF (GntR family)
VKKRTYAQLARMLGVHQETIPKALIALETHGLLAIGPDYYELIRPDADKLAWFRDATRPSYITFQESQKAALVSDDPKLEVMQQMVGGGIPVGMSVQIAEFCEKNSISWDNLRRYYQKVRITHKQHQLEGRYTEINHCGFLLKTRLEKIAKK